MVPPHRRQSTSDTATAVTTSTWQLEQRKIAASQEIVVTTTTLTLQISERVASLFHLAPRFLSKLSSPIQRVLPQT
jgi:hypothetical protein